MTTENISKRLSNHFRNSQIEVSDVTGQSNHFSIFILSKQFESMSLVERHKMIYKIFEKELTQKIHALQIKALTYKEWNQKK